MRFILRTISTLALALLLIGAAAVLLLYRSLPQLDGEVLTANLVADATIERDAYGVPTITAANRVDLAFATGYAHGQDRFFQMDLTRRTAAGELAALIGAIAVPMDRRNRLHRFRARAAAVIERSSDFERRVFEAYAAGVNTGLDELGARPFEYFILRAKPQAWQVEDSLLAVYAMFLELNDERATRDVRRGLAHSVLPEALFAWLYPDGTEWDAPLLGEPRTSGIMPAPGVVDFAGPGSSQPLDVNADDEGVLPGSNNWAVGGSLTTTGGAIVANDMHLGLTAPNVFYRARLRIAGSRPIDLNGVTLPGAPVIVAGSNGRIAWGNTNSYGDWSDAVIVVPGDAPDTYATAEGPRAFDVHEEVIVVRGGQPETMQVRETIWGPVLDDAPDPDRTLAVSWIAHHPEAVTIGHLELETATSVNEALDIANRIGMPPQNFVVGDTDGNIGWTIAGRIPRRVGYDPLLPADWSSGAGWHGWVPPEDYPRVVNPADARIWTANARVVDGVALDVIGDGGYDLGARARQIRDGLFARDRFVPSDMLPVQLDDRALLHARWRELLLSTLDDAAIAGNPERATYRRLAEQWIPRAAPESTGYRLVREFRTEVRARVFAMLMRPVAERYGEETRLRRSNQFEGPLWSMVTEQPPHLLAPGANTTPRALGIR